MYEIDRFPLRLKDKEIIEMLESEELNCSQTILLEESLFYYCCGKDPSPISAFGSSFPLYVYVDSFIYVNESFDDALKILYERIEDLNFKLKSNDVLKPKGRIKRAINAQLSIWENEKREEFALLYLQADAIEGFIDLYESEVSYLTPRCICNFLYEMRTIGVLARIERDAEYIFGYSFNKSHCQIGEYPYLGDYGKEQKIKLFKLKYLD